MLFKYYERIEFSMLSFIYPRLETELRLLLDTKDYVSGKEMASNVSVSERTVRNDIKILNDTLERYSAIIRNIRGRGYMLDCSNSTKEILKSTITDNTGIENLDTLENRVIYFIYLLLLKDAVSIDDILGKIYISYNTLNNYIYIARTKLKDYNLQIVKNGEYLTISGDELDKRKYIIECIEEKNYTNYITDFSKREKQLFNNIDMYTVSQIIKQYFLDKYPQISDYGRKNIIIHFLLAISRSNIGYTLQNFKNSIYIDERMKSDIDDMLEKLADTTQYKIGQYEREYIIHHILLNSPHYINDNVINNEMLEHVIIDFLRTIKEKYSFDLLQDQELKRNLHIHLKTVLKINKYKDDRKNPLLDVIISTFPLAYEITITTAKIIEEGLDLKLSKDELSFITLHIGSSMEKIYDNRWQKKNAVIICGSGTATASLLKHKLSSRFSNYLNIVGLYSFSEYQHIDLENIDFIISTVPIKHPVLKVIQIDLAKYTEDSKELYDYLTTTCSELTKIYNLFSEKTCYIHRDFTDKKEIINFLGNEFLNYGLVQENFLNEVWKREEMYTTAIGGEIAIPHPVTFSSVDSRVGVVSLKQPIIWDKNGNNVRYIFLLAINKDDYSKIQMLFNFLVSLQNDRRFNEIFQKCQSPKEAIRVIRSFIKLEFN